MTDLLSRWKPGCLLLLYVDVVITLLSWILLLMIAMVTFVAFIIRLLVMISRSYVMLIAVSVSVCALRSVPVDTRLMTAVVARLLMVVITRSVPLMVRGVSLYLHRVLHFSQIGHCTTTAIVV